MRGLNLTPLPPQNTIAFKYHYPLSHGLFINSVFIQIKLYVNRFYRELRVNRFIQILKEYSLLYSKHDVENAFELAMASLDGEFDRERVIERITAEKTAVLADNDYAAKQIETASQIIERAAEQGTSTKTTTIVTPILKLYFLRCKLHLRPSSLCF